MLHSHLNYKPHRCPYCPKSFSRKDHLNRHLSQHSEDKQYICEFCMKSFTRKEHLNRHLWVHKDTFPFPCSLCSRAYTDENRLSKHIKKCHFVDNNTALETISALNINSNNNVTTID
uniref:Chorion transcription factor Cf2 n=1 Tax=Cacopsylla melanoneura TaxID=428564 RepID=A0A8D9AG07_9HEMI